MSEMIYEVHKGRDVLFNIFSRMFADITDNFSDNLIIDTYQYLINMAEISENADLMHGGNLLKNLLMPDGQKWLMKNRTELARDFTSLFILGKNAVSPYESVYLSPERLMKQEPWSEVKLFYAQNGFKKHERNSLEEDHVSIELQFMGLLCKRMWESGEKDDLETFEKTLSVQNDFYDNHLNKWIPQFCDQIINKELNTEFYCAFAYLLKGFLAEDKLLLEELITK